MATKNYSISEDPGLLAARRPGADLKAKQLEIKSIIDRLSRETSSADFESAIAAVTSGADPVLAAEKLDSAKALEAAENALRLVSTALDRSRFSAEREYRAAQSRYVERATPRYREIAARMASALVKLGEVQVESMIFESECRADGLTQWPIESGPIGITDFGDPRIEPALISHWLIAAVAAGAIEASAIPRAWSDGWPLLQAFIRGNPGDAEASGLRRLRGNVSAPSSRLGPVRRRA